jgi:diamine N-acetyltransferase
MDSPVTLADLSRSPDLFTSTFTLPDETAVTFRLLLQADARILGAYFTGLSADTRRRYAPHPFDQATADQLCAEIDFSKNLRLIATLQKDGQEQGIAYIILVPGVADVEVKRYAGVGVAIDSASVCTLAPSVADAYQSQGLGSRLMVEVKRSARRLGFKRMILMGGVQKTNERGVHFYKKNGFVSVNQFEHPVGMINFDMIMDL